MTREYPITTAVRSGLLTVAEHTDRIALRLTFDRYGDFGDEADIVRQLRPIFAAFDRDPRPLVLDAPDYGSRARIDCDRDGRAFAIVETETRQ
jgi:hypothetical protein